MAETFDKFLNEKRTLDERLYDIEEKVSSLRAVAEKSTSVLSPAPGGNSCNDSRIEELVIRIADLKTEEKKKKKEMQGASAELSIFLSQLPEKEMKVMLLYYVDLKTTDEIAEALGYTSRHLYKLFRQAKQHASELFLKKGQVDDSEKTGQCQ